MIWKRNCRRVRSLLALWAGHDLDETSQQEARRHMAACPHCRTHWQYVQASQYALEQARLPSPASAVATGSVWREVYSQISSQRALAERRSVYGWFPAGALVAACVAVAVLSFNTPPFDHLAPNAAEVRAVHAAVQPAWPMGTRSTDQPFPVRPHWVSEETVWRPVGPQHSAPLDFTEPRGF